MHSNFHPWPRGRLAALLAAAFTLSAGAGATVIGNAPADVAGALRAMPEADVVHATRDGVPQFLRGDLGRVPVVNGADLAAAQRAMRPALGPIVGAMRLDPAELQLRKINTKPHGDQHLRFRQTHQGLDVIGGDLVVHVDGKGKVFAVNGTARGDFPATLGARDIGESAVHGHVMGSARHAGMATSAPRKVYFLSPEGSMHLAYETVVTGRRGLDPVRDKVYVDADTGAILGVHPQIHFLENRAVYSANNGTTLPGTVRRTEGQAATADVDVNAAYDGTGATYEAYKLFFNRDSYNNLGAQLRSSVHYSTNYCNAFWNGTQMVYGDGNTAQGCLPLARAQDVTAHELTHAVTENESGLIYSGESGGLNEAMSDIFGAFTEAFVDGGKTGTLAVSANTWKIGEVVLPPALRYMNDPAADGSSLDFYTASAGTVDVHFSSGIANLAFYLMSQGGTHPRGKSTVVVPGLGMDKAIRIFYEANVNVLTANATFLSAGNATVQAAINLGYSVADQTAVAKAWQAVGVPVPTPGSPPPPDTDVVLSNGVAVGGIAGASGSQQFYKLAVPAGQSTLTFKISGGTGDVDLYTRLGSHPTLTTFDCRPFVSGNNETCTVNNPAAGTYFVLLNGFSAYTGVTLTGTYAVSAGIPSLTNGVPVAGIAGASGVNQFWKVTVPAGRTLAVKISGGTGDADLYVRQGAQPTTATFNCRPFLNGNNETCSIANTVAGDYYVMIRGFSAFTGVTLLATF